MCRLRKRSPDFPTLVYCGVANNAIMHHSWGSIHKRMNIGGPRLYADFTESDLIHPPSLVAKIKTTSPRTLISPLDALACWARSSISHHRHLVPSVRLSLPASFESHKRDWWHGCFVLSCLAASSPDPALHRFFPWK